MRITCEWQVIPFTRACHSLLSFSLVSESQCEAPYTNVQFTLLTASQVCSPKKEVGGTPETRLRQRFLNNLGLHTRTLIHVRKIATADLWSCAAIQLVVFEFL